MAGGGLRDHVCSITVRNHSWEYWTGGIHDAIPVVISRSTLGPMLSFDWRTWIFQSSAPLLLHHKKSVCNIAKEIYRTGPVM